MQNVYGNPHSRNPSSQLTTDIIDQVRYRVLEHFHTTAKDYTVIFTSGTTGALRLLADSFDWQGKCSESQSCHSHFCYLQQNHTSVVGMREVAATSGAHVIPVLEEEIQPAQDFCVNSKFSSCMSVKGGPSKQDQHQTMINAEAIHLRSKFPANYPSKEAELTISDCRHHNLFAYPAMCNFSGRKYPLQWVKSIQTRSLMFCHSSCDSEKYSKNWFVLLDAASHISSSPLDLTSCSADFIPISFYKLFGFPTGLGALLVRNNSAHVLRKCYYGGGSVSATISSERFHVARSSVSDRY